MTKVHPNTPVQNPNLMPPWPEFGRVAKIQGWIEELKNAKDSQPTANDWRLMGRAVMISHPVEELRQPLIQKIAQEAGYEYLRVSSEDFFEWVNESKPIPATAPLMVHVEQGIWSGKIDDDKKAAAELREFQTTDLPKYLAQLPNDLIIVFVVTGKSYADLNPLIRTVGVFDRRFDIAEPALVDVGAWFLNQIGTDHCDKSLLSDTARVGKLINDEFEDRRRQEMIALHLQRLAHRESRAVNFDDLVYFAVHGGSETDYAPEDDAPTLYRIAVHEAGHALVSMIDSHGQNIPDFASIMPSGHFKGVVTDSYAYSLSLTGRYTYEDSRHKIRVQLAGRVAEAVVFGPTRVGTFGARSDLRNATAWAKDLVGLYGFSAEQETPDAIRDNLAVIDDEATPSEAAHIEAQTRLMLKRQYEAVELLIIEHRELLDAITQALLEQCIMNQTELSRLWSNHVAQTTTNAPPTMVSHFQAMNPVLAELNDLFSGKEKTDMHGITRRQIIAMSDDHREKISIAIQKHIFLNNRGIAFYALTKNRWHYAANIMAMFSALTLDELFGGKLSEKAFKRLSETTLRFLEAPLYFDETPGLSTDERVEGLLRLTRMNYLQRLGAVICDRPATLDKRFLDYCAQERIEVILLDQ